MPCVGAVMRCVRVVMRCVRVVCVLGVCVCACWCVVVVVVCCVVCVVVCGVVFVVVWHAENPRVCIQHVPVCAFKMSPCVPATCPHFFRGHVAGTHGDILNAHTGTC